MKVFYSLVGYILIGSVFAVLLSNFYKSECGYHIGQEEFELLIFAWPSIPVMALLAEDPKTTNLDDGRPGYCEVDNEQL